MFKCAYTLNLQHNDRSLKILLGTDPPKVNIIHSIN